MKKTVGSFLKFTAKLSHFVILIIGLIFFILYDSFSEIKVTSVRACAFNLCAHSQTKEKVFSRPTQCLALLAWQSCSRLGR